MTFLGPMRELESQGQTTTPEIWRDRQIESHKEDLTWSRSPQNYEPLGPFKW